MSLNEINALRPAIAEAANRVFKEAAKYREETPKDEWEHSGGICDEIAEAIADILLDNDIEAATFNTVESGENHTFVVSKDTDDEAILVDIPYCLYEVKLGEYEFDLLPAQSVHILPSDIIVEKLGIPFAEFSGPLTTKGVEDYEGLKRYLESPERKVYIPSLFTKRDCAPKEDPEWPTPTNRNEAEALLGRLPDRSQVICALTAAELVLPIWEEQWEPGSPDIDLRPREAIEVTWRWLEGEASLEEIRQAEEAAWWAAAGAAWAAARAAWAAARAAARAAAWPAGAAWLAAGAADEAGWMPYVDFLELWWKECRCRLAMEKPEAQELTTGAQVPAPRLSASLADYLNNAKMLHGTCVPHTPMTSRERWHENWLAAFGGFYITPDKHIATEAAAMHCESAIATSRKYGEKAEYLTPVLWEIEVQPGTAFALDEDLFGWVDFVLYAAAAEYHGARFRETDEGAGPTEADIEFFQKPAHLRLHEKLEKLLSSDMQLFTDIATDIEQINILILQSAAQQLVPIREVKQALESISREYALPILELAARLNSPPPEIRLLESGWRVIKETALPKSVIQNSTI